jgi:enoyl-CoA hydratase/carnithine racemase
MDIREGKSSPLIIRALACAIGARRALELALSGRVFSIPEALAWGLVHHVAPAFELDDRAMEVAGGIAHANPEAIREMLKNQKSPNRDG